jgi:DNA polymerase-4
MASEQDPSSGPHILHVDMDAYYASIEMRDDPSLAGKPLCVGGGGPRGVISSASYEARRFGVRNAMPTGQARSLCPELVILPPDFEKYTRISQQIMRIFRSYTPLVEPLSLDEAFLDVRGCDRLFGDGETIARSIKRDILRDTGLVASVGVAPTKFVAKLASDLDKPDGLKVIHAHEVRSVLDPLPVHVIFGVGERTARRLAGFGVKTVGDLAARERGEVLARFGASGAWIYDLAHGVDARRVHPRREERSFSVERTFPEDVSDREELHRRLLEFAEELAYRLRDRGLRSRTLALKARFGDFRTISRTRTLERATNLGPRLYALARSLFERVPRAPLRLLGLSVSGLEDVRAPVQGELFPAASDAAEQGKTARAQRAAGAMDRLRRKYGRPAVLPASLLEGADPASRRPLRANARR